MNSFLRMATFRKALALGLCGAFLSMAAPGHSATQQLLQTFAGSKDNQFTRTITPAGGTGVRVGTDDTGVFDLVAPQFSADLFDASLGTLQSVQLIYEGTFDGSNRVTEINSACNALGAFTSCESRSLKVDYTIDFGVFSSVGSVDEVSTKRSTTLDNANTAFLGGSKDLLAQQTLTSVSDLAAYSGAGTFDLTAFFFPTMDGTYSCDPRNFSAINQCFSRYRAFYGADFDISVIYTYDDGITPQPPSAVPLPAGLPMLIGALSLLGWTRRRRS